MPTLRFMELDDNKKPLHSFDTFAVDKTNYKNYGFVIGKDLVLVDFDEKSKAADFIAQEYPTLKVYTDRGFHLYYRKPKGIKIGSYTKNVTALGIHADFKTGDKTQGVLKKGGIERKIENEHYLHGETDAIPELPPLLYPTRMKEPLLNLKEGEGRNDALYRHLVNVASIYPSYRTGKLLFKLATIINHLVFAEPMPDKETNSVAESVLTRDLADNQLYLDKKDIVMTTKYITVRLNVHQYKGMLYFYNESIMAFDCDTGELERAIFKLIELEKKDIDKIIALLHVTSKKVSQYDQFSIQLAGGFLLDNGEPIELHGEFTPYYAPTRYRPDAYCKKADDFLNFVSCNDKELRMVIEEMFGHVLLTHQFPHTSFFLVGEKGGNGKSTILDMVRGMIGHELTSSLQLDRFDDDTSLKMLAGKLVNLGDDIDASYVEKNGNFKSLVSGETITLRPIYSQPMELTSSATLIFSCNEIPKFKDKTGGLGRRVKIIPFDNSLPPEKFDLSLKDHFKKDDAARSYILNLAIEGVKRIRANGNTFSYSKRIEEATKEYLMDNDLLSRYFNEMGEEIEFEGKVTTQCYNDFIQWCIGLGENGYRFNTATFGKAVKKYTGLITKQKRMNKNVFRVYVKPDK